MEHLGNPEFPEVIYLAFRLFFHDFASIFHFPQILDDDIATHVVTGIEYGCDAFFTFEKDLKGKTFQRMQIYSSKQLKLFSFCIWVFKFRLLSVNSFDTKSG